MSLANSSLYAEAEATLEDAKEIPRSGLKTVIQEMNSLFQLKFWRKK